MEGLRFHYTNDKGYKAISALPTWVFKASKAPAGHPKGAYFTTLPPARKTSQSDCLYAEARIK
jgi:hypothetical protein